MYYSRSFLSCIVEVPKELRLDLNSCLGCDLRCERPNYLGHSPEMSSTLKNPKISIRTLFFAIYLHQRVQYVVCACSSYLALSEYVTYNWIALIFLSLLMS